MSEQSVRMSALERRYRGLLRLLPAAYRRAWLEEMVTTFLAGTQTDDAEWADYLADYGKPSWSEVASVVGLAIRLRLPAGRLGVAGTGVPPRNAMWGDAVRLVALIGLLVHAALAASSILMVLWLSGRAPWLAPPPPESQFVSQSVGFRLTTLGGFLWLPAYLALLFGQRRVCLLLALLAIVIANLVPVVDPTQPVTVSQAFFVVFDAVPVVALLGFHRDAPPIRYRPWLLALPIGWVVVVGTEVLGMPDDLHTLPLLDWPATSCVAFLIVAAWHLVRRGHALASWPLALALLAPDVLGRRALTLLYLVEASPAPQRPTLLMLGVAEAVAVLAVALALATVAVHALRRLPNPT